MGLLGLGPLVMPKATGAGGERAWHHGIAWGSGPKLRKPRRA